MKTKSAIRTIFDSGDEEEGVPPKITIGFTGEISIEKDKAFSTLRTIIKADYAAREYCRTIGYELPYDDGDVTNMEAADEIAATVLGSLLRARVAEVLGGMERSMYEKAGVPVPKV